MFLNPRNHKYVPTKIENKFVEFCDAIVEFYNPVKPSWLLCVTNTLHTH